MQLTASQLTPFACGISHSQIIDGHWCPERIFPSLRHIYERAEGSQIRMACTAGVGLRFMTDAKALTVTWRYGVAARQKFQGTVICGDSPPIAMGATEKTDQWSGKIALPQSEGPRRVELWLPHLCQTHVAQLDLHDADVAEPVAPAPQWLAFGDSITQGMTSHLPTDSVVPICAAALKVDANNLAIGGAICDPALATSLPEADPQLVTVAYGANDFNKAMPVQEHGANIRSLVKALAKAYPRALRVLITNIQSTRPRFDAPNEAGDTVADFRAAQAAVAAETDKDMLVVDGAALVDKTEDCFIDGLHPMEKGFAQYGQRLSVQIAPHLAAVTSAESSR